MHHGAECHSKHQQLSSLVDTYRANYDLSGFGGFIGMSMQAVYRILESAAPSKGLFLSPGKVARGKKSVLKLSFA